MGIDAEDGNIDFGNHGGLTPYVDVISNGLLPNTSNGGDGILVIGGGKDAFDDVTRFWDSVGAGVGEAVTYANGAAGIGAQSFAGFQVVAIVSSGPQTVSGGLTDAENNALSGRAADIANHVNGGGGLFGLSQQGLSVPYGYLGSVGAFTFAFPSQFSDVEATADGEAVGITDINMDVCCWHDEYLTFPGFLNVLATNVSTDNACALGGFEVIIVQDIALTPLAADNPVGSDHTVTATVVDDMGDPVVGVEVNFEIVAGPHVGTMDSDFTNGAGQAFFTWTGVAEGTDTVVACFIDNNQEQKCATARKTWVETCYTIDFETDDTGMAMSNGQIIDTEFDGDGDLPVITGVVNFSGLNTLAIADTNGGPLANDPDLLVGTGNALMLQRDGQLAECGPGFYCTPNDDENGGTITFDFVGTVNPMSIRLIDCDVTDGLWSVALVDAIGNQRTYFVPGGWTGDINVDGPPGMGTLDLTILADQPGFMANATATEDLDFDSDGIVQIVVTVGGSGAIDDLAVCRTSTGAIRASSSSRNGTNFNKVDLVNAAMPVIGGTWAATMDCSPFGSGTATMYVWGDALPGMMTRFGERLITGDRYFAKSQPIVKTNMFTLKIPNDSSLAGLDFHVQGACMGMTQTLGNKIVRLNGGLSNALDLILGY